MQNQNLKLEWIELVNHSEFLSKEASVVSLKIMLIKRNILLYSLKQVLNETINIQTQ